MSLCVESALRAFLRPRGPPPAVLQELPGPPTEPQLSAKAPAFQPGRTWQKPVAAPDVQAAGWSCSKDHRHQAPVEEGPSTSGVFIAAALQAKRGVSSRCQSNVPSAQFRQCHASAPVLNPGSQSVNGPSSQQPGAKPPPTRPDLHWHPADAHLQEFAHAHRQVPINLQWHASEEDIWEEGWEDWQEWWRQEWRGAFRGDWAARNGRNPGSWPSNHVCWKHLNLTAHKVAR